MGGEDVVGGEEDGVFVQVSLSLSPWSHLVAWRYGHTLEVVSSVFTPMCPAHLRKACLLSKEQG